MVVVRTKNNLVDRCRIRQTFLPLSVSTTASGLDDAFEVFDYSHLSDWTACDEIMNRGRGCPSFGGDVDHSELSVASNSTLTISCQRSSYFHWDTNNLCVCAIMAAKQVARPFVRHSLTFSASQHISRPVALQCPFDHFPARRRLSQYRPARSAFIAGQRRAFSGTVRTRYATVEDSVDPRDQPRESDEVDVCIVGGGMSTTSHSLSERKLTFLEYIH